MGRVSDRKEHAGSEEFVASAAMQELISRLASFPRGVAFLDTGELECVAITFGVCPDLVLQAREYLASPARRAWFLEHVRLANRASPEPWHPPRPQPGAPAPGPRTLAGLVRAADQHRYGLSFLLESPPETVAVVFCVHPQRVLRARALYARWKARRDRTSGS